ncbi:MAG: hypothetical protein ACI4S9_02130 [Christensenellales bacterium]
MFNDSCVKKVYPYRAVEENTAIPDKIQPVYLGSSVCTMSFDATGMQGLNNRLQDSYAPWPRSCDMYVVKNGMIGDVLSPHNTIPLAWLDYTLTIDGEEFDAQRISECASMFRREIDIKRSVVVTEYILKGVKVNIEAVIPYGTATVYYAFTFQSYDRNFPVCKEVRNIGISVKVNFTTRDGRKIYDDIKTEGDGALTCFVKGHEDYTVNMKFSARKTVEAISDVRTAYVLLGDDAQSGENVSERYTFCASFDGKYTLNDYDRLSAENIRDWNGFWNDVARIEYSKTEEVFLFNQSLYLLHAGYEPSLGMPIGHPFSFPGCWQASVFWDAHFSMDAFMRSGCKKSAEEFITMLHRIMRTQGKPFPWMFIYDGTTFLDDKHDIAPLVISAQAMIAVRYYEIYRDEKVFKNEIYPILKACCDYALNNMYGKDASGRWVVSMAVSNDVVDEEGDEVNQTFTNLWFAVLFKKLIEYSEKFGIRISPKYYEIIQNLYIEQNDEEYLHCRGQSAEQARWASWLPFLYYPTECMPFIDETLFNKTHDKYSYVELYHDKQNSYQPWTEFIESQSDHRAGRLNDAYDLMRHGMEHTFGAGYFSEIGPQQQTVGAPPYLSAHSTFVSTVIDTFVSGSVWKREVGLFDNLPLALAQERVEISHMVAPQKFFVKRAVYTPDGVYAEVEGELQGTTLRIRAPEHMRADDIRVFVNEKRVECKFDRRKKIIETVFPESGACTVEVR